METRGTPWEPVLNNNRSRIPTNIEANGATLNDEGNIEGCAEEGELKFKPKCDVEDAEPPERKQTEVRPKEPSVDFEPKLENDNPDPKRNMTPIPAETRALSITKRHQKDVRVAWLWQLN